MGTVGLFIDYEALQSCFMHGAEPVCSCNGGGLPQCYVCNNTDKAACERLQVLQTCPSNEVCTNEEGYNLVC